ncbi:DoxX family protein [Mycolicibacterium bacteremicum]|uniref:DoxX family protein n=1 Tax=Mycolicibacterium bacteremicum TaxID=564198 RepID=UPI0021F27CC2|nr:DoxX family protein [Mycolicibacterium bacteremicum]MCV7430637.1 DoxX family protein [Mycolicibacterium bacteremicum]
MTTSTTAVETRLASNTPVVLGVFRILVGLMFVMHGTVKLFGFPSGSPAAVGTWPAWWAGVLEVVLGLLITVGFFTRIPAWWAGVLEVVLGLLITVGFFTRIAAFVASGMMAVAYFWMHFPDGFWPIDNGGETAALYSFIFLLLVFTGPGALSINRR